MMQAQQIHISQGVMSVQMGGKSVLHAALHRGVRSVDGVWTEERQLHMADV